MNEINLNSTNYTKEEIKDTNTLSLFLNTQTPLTVFTRLLRSKYFVDKSMIIDKLNEVIDTSDNYVCITKPRRFGKSSIADMLVSYYTKALDSKVIFDPLDISNTDSYSQHLNKYNVISISFNEIPDGELTYLRYINNIIDKLKREIITTFDISNLNQDFSLRRILELSGEKFIFIFDEWDYIFSNNLFEDSQDIFLEFLRNLPRVFKKSFKGQVLCLTSLYDWCTTYKEIFKWECT